MPLNLMEAKQVFVRQVERDKADFNTEVQRIEAMQMGAQVIEGLMRKVQELETLLRKNNIPVPGDQPATTPMRPKVIAPIPPQVVEAVPSQEEINQAGS